MEFNNYILMLEDIPVLSVNFQDMETHIWHKDLLPYSLRKRLKEPSPDNIKEYYKEMAYNISIIKDYASSRVLSLSRDNAKQIYAACQISQDSSIDNRVNICLSCKGISVNDAYWFKKENSKDTWKTVNIKKNHLSEIVDIALEGKQPTFTIDATCPELTTKGLFKKAWIRENEDLFLLKSDKLTNFDNTRAEVLSSKILDCTNVPHVQYDLIKYHDLFVAKCRNFVPEGQSFIEAHEVISFCKDIGINYTKQMVKKFNKDFANIAIVDYLLQNTDRHDQNYGFLMDNRTGELLSVAPLFDHNQALLADWLGKDVTDTLSQMLPEGLSIEETANSLEPYANIQWNIEKWEKLKQEYPKQKDLFSNIEKRMSYLVCINKHYGVHNNLEEESDILL